MSENDSVATEVIWGSLSLWSCVCQVCEATLQLSIRTLRFQICVLKKSVTHLYLQHEPLWPQDFIILMPFQHSCQQCFSPGLLICLKCSCLLPCWSQQLCLFCYYTDRLPWGCPFVFFCRPYWICYVSLFFSEPCTLRFVSQQSQNSKDAKAVC